jgi:serine/threonine protein kinase
MQVAVKCLKKKIYSWKECMALREIESLKSIASHENIVGIKELIREDSSLIFFVFEYMPNGNLYDVIKNCALDRSRGIPNNSLSKSKISSLVSQVLKGLDHIHSHGFVHRDLKPENLLLNGGILKIADFGLARQPKSSPSAPDLTAYISTRWYRSPEILLRDPNYGAPVDIFALGCVMAEMISLRPLFPGSNEIDQIHQITNILGAPCPTVWPEGLLLIERLKIASLFPHGTFLGGTDLSATSQNTNTKLQRAIPEASSETIAILKNMLCLDPQMRPSALLILSDPSFQSMMSVESPLEKAKKLDDKITTTRTSPSNVNYFANANEMADHRYNVSSRRVIELQ